MEALAKHSAISLLSRITNITRHLSLPALGPSLSRRPSTVFSRGYNDVPGQSAGSVSATTPPSPDEFASAANNIAVIGYGCRVAGGNNSPDQLWEFLISKRDAVGEIPQMRWKPYYTRQSENASVLSKTTSKGYFLNRLEDFDAAFFGISPREAEQMDPQQRIILEVTWEALESAGIPPQDLAGSDTAVFMGVNSDDYGKLLLEDLPNVEAWMGVGTAYCGIPNRLSYLLDLRGPSTAIDTACASSLCAIHHAKQSLLSGESSLAIVGGVNALIGPGLTSVLDKAGVLSDDGRCRSLDQGAAGYGRGEGAGVVILKRLADALQDEDRIIAVLKGSAVGANGKTNGIMAPDSAAQERVARIALKEAGCSGASISYIEAHATSTPLGDPTEFTALENVYGSGSSARSPGSRPCYVGSIKSNIGHLEAGAGVLGFIKAAMVIDRAMVPPQANLSVLSSKLNMQTSALEPVMEAKTLQATCWPIRAAVASYGYGGSVSHAILEARPTQRPSIRQELTRILKERNVTLFVLSAPAIHRIQTVAKHLLKWLKESKQEIDLEAVAYTLAVKRGHHKFRTAVVVDNLESVLQSLDMITQNQPHDQVFNARVSSNTDRKGPIWVFSGHGAQWSGMGQKLLQNEPVFAGIVSRLETIAMAEVGFSLIEALKQGEFDTSDKVQVLTYVVQVGLAETLKSKGAHPYACVGHSLGELAASVIAGAISMEEGARICFIRARLYRQVAGKGAMAMISLSFEETHQRLAARPDIYAAIDSSPHSCVISGTSEAIKHFLAECEEDAVATRLVNSDVAFHTPLLSDLVKPMRESLASSIIPQVPRIPLYSTSLPDPRGTDLRNLDYWVNNMIQPVLFKSTINAIAIDGYAAFLEISSHPIVSHSIRECLLDTRTTESLVIPTLLRNKDEQKCLMFVLGKLHCIGAPVNFRQFLFGDWIHSVPRTIWEHVPYWRAVTDNFQPYAATHDAQSHTLLGPRTLLARTDNVLWQTQLNSQNKPFPGNHPLHGSEIVPAAVLMNTFYAAASGQIQNVHLRVPVVVDQPREIQIFREHDHLRISSKLVSSQNVESTDSSWLVNTTAHISAMECSSLGSLDLVALKGRLGNHLSSSFSIDYLAKVGVSEMGFPWKVMEHVEASSEMLALVDADPTCIIGSPHFGGDSWASVLDSATSISSTIFYKEPLLRMPTSINQLSILPGAVPPKLSYVYVEKVAGLSTVDVRICNEEGNIIIDIRGLSFAGIEGNITSSKKHDIGLVHQVAWPPAQCSEMPLEFHKVVFLSGETPQLDSYVTQLTSRGIHTQTICGPGTLSNLERGSIVVFLPEGAESYNDIYRASAANCKLLLDSVKQLLMVDKGSKLFVITQGAFDGKDTKALSQSPLIGLARIVQSESADVFGGLIDAEDCLFPWQAVRYVQGRDVIRIQDSVPCNARLRPFTQTSELPGGTSFHIRPQGTYLITGGLGALGLEVASFLVENGARRIVLVCRRALPARRNWKLHLERVDIQGILRLESLGATIYPVTVDVTAPNAAEQLQTKLDSLGLPPVLGVTHAAGTLANQTVIETTPEAFNSVISPKILGAVALHTAFPPGALDFFVMFSSCGQLLGFPGQAAYASGNAFLDSLASARRAVGENAISMLWTSWRGLGMAASTRYIDAELAARGITDITKEEAFRAWKMIFGYNTNHAVVLRTIPLDAHEASPHPILDESIVRRAPITGEVLPSDAAEVLEPTTDSEREACILKKVTKSVADTLSLAPGDIDPHIAMAELGMDSVMTVELRGHLQKSLGMRIGPTLVWTCPTIKLLVEHFMNVKKN